jgi:hypothetical protein
MVDDRFAANPPVDQLPQLAWFGVYCARPPRGGFWDPDEEGELDAIEKDLVRLCEHHSNGWAAYVQDHGKGSEIMERGQVHFSRKDSRPL